MVQGEDTVTRLTGLEVFLPDGRRLGVVHDAVVDANGMQCTHLFVRDPDEALVEGSVHVAIPWRWIRAIDQIVLVPSIWRSSKAGFQADGFPEEFQILVGSVEHPDGIKVASFNQEDQLQPRIQRIGAQRHQPEAR